MSTSGSGMIVKAEYRSEAYVEYAQVVCRSDDGFDWGLGMADSTLLEPIDYDAEIAERQETHEPMSDVGGKIGNSRFGV